MSLDSINASAAAPMPSSLPTTPKQIDAGEQEINLSKNTDDLSLEADEDENINDEASEILKLKQLQDSLGLFRKSETQDPAELENDFQAIRKIRGSRLFDSHDLEISLSPLGAFSNPTLDFWLMSPLAEKDWPMFVEYQGHLGLYDPKDYDIPMAFNDTVEQWVDFFTGRGRVYFKRWLMRSTRFIPIYRDIIKQYGIPQDTVYLSMIESGFNTRAYSRAKASGPWQFMPATGRMYGLKTEGWVDERRDYIKATHAAAQYLKALYDRFGDWHLSWASYNAGEGKISKALNQVKTRDFFELAAESKILKPETKNYVPKLLAAAIIAKSPKRFGFTDIEFLEPFSFETIDIEGPVRLEHAALACQCDIEELYDLNPSLKYGITPPHEHFELRIPKGKKDIFIARLKEVLPKQSLDYKIYYARRGETVQMIAKKLGSSSDLIREHNKLTQSFSRFSSKQEILVPLLPDRLHRQESELLARQDAKRKTSHSKTDTESHAQASVHVVKAGESLTEIAKKYGVTVDLIKKLNRLTRPTKIYPGLALKIRSKR